MSVRSDLLILKTSRPGLKASLRLCPQPLDHTRVVVTVAQIVIQRGETVLLTGLLHRLQLRLVELWRLDSAPVVSRRIHRKAWAQRAVRADDDVVLAGAQFQSAN